MINDKVRMYLLPPLFNAAVRAGASIMKVYKNRDDYDISLKEDHTPITLADRMAHRTIREYLGPTRIPILSEEGREMRYEERCNWELYWLVDPLDGTVEFIKGNNEFTVNIALMENNVCMGAVIYVPYYEKAFTFVKAHRDEPTLVFLYTVHTDHAGHKYKWMSPEYIRSIEEADTEIGRLLDKLKAEDLFDDTHFLFLTDHGGIEYGHGGVSIHEMIVPWGIASPGIAKGLTMTEPNNTVNTAAVILRLFGVDKPLSWTGEVPESIFE